MILSFILTCLIIELTPGPNMAYLAILSAGKGVRAGFSAVFGIALGLLVIGVLAALGVSSLISGSPMAYQILRWAGVLYLFWLAWDGWHDETETSPGKTENTAQDAMFFRRGLVANLLNPKAAIFYIAILPGFISGPDNIMLQGVFLSVLYVVIATAIHSLIVALSGLVRRFYEDSRRSRIVRRGLSLLLAGVALWFAVETGNFHP